MATNKLFEGYETINELIIDKENIVTAISLANELKISTLKAQTLLNDFVKCYLKSNTKEIYPTYLLGGTLKNNKGGKILIIKEEELEKTKDLFEDTSIEIVYSVQAFKHVDLNAIASVNATYDIREPLFTSKNSEKRNLPEKKIIAPPTQQSTSKLFKTFSNGNSTTASTTETLKSTNNQTKKTNKANNAFSSFFTKGPVKTETNSSPQNKSGNTGEKKNESVKVSPPKSEAKLENANKKEKSPERKIETTATQKSDKTKDKKRKKQNQSGRENKKRKRIQEICDSDSSDMFDDEENEKSKDIIEFSEEEEQKPAVQIVTPATKSKKRKAIDKTYEEDGFVVTKTEFVYESGSEEEIVPSKIKPEVLAEKKNDKPNGEMKAKPSKGKGNKKETNSKQPTLMSFFKKA